ncbi:MAG TPA: lasso peptide biosynthesis B2 protein [Longimicrobiaceae bacterium]
MTRLLRRLRALPAGERRLLFHALAALAAARVVLWVLPFRTVHRRMRRPVPHPSPVDDSAASQVKAVDRAVARASRVVPRASCFVQALAARELLRRRGIDAEVRLGVATSADGGFRAHAWVEAAGVVLAAGADPAGYHPFPLADGPSR